MKKSLDSLFEKYITISEQHAGKIITLALLIGLICLWPISKIRLDPDLDDLLPRDTPTIRAMHETNKRFGSADLFTIAIQMDNVEECARVQQEIKNEIEKTWDDALYVQIERDNAFFMKHALLYLPVENLSHILSNLEELELELGARGPLVVDLSSGDSTEEQVINKNRVWFDADLPQELGLPDEAASVFQSFLNTTKEDEAEGSGEKAEAFNPKAGIPDSLKNRLMGWHSDGTLNAVVQAALKEPSSNTQYARDVINRTEKMLAPIRARYGDKIDVGIEGSYQVLKQVESLAINGIIATIISIGLIVVVIFTFFRSFGALLAILSQVAVTCTYTMAITGLIYGRLNLYSVFVIAILLGLGIDYSIHILGHAQKDARKGKSWHHAFTDTLKALFRPMLLAALTTVAGMLTLLAADFIGFYEFGVIASIGITFSLLSAILLLPPLVFLFERTGNIPVFSWFLRLPATPSRQLIPKFLLIQNWGRSLTIATIIITVGSFVMIFFATRAGFEYDFKNLRDTGNKLESKRHTGVAISSSRRSSQPVVALAKNPETMVALHDTLLYRLTVEKDTLLRSFLTLTTFVPPAGKQDNRMEVIEEIGDIVGYRVFDRSTGSDSIMIQKLRDMSDVEAFTAEDIPKWALHLVQERDGSYGRIAFIYGSFMSSNAIEAGKFQNRYGAFHLNGEDISLYSSSFIYSDIIRLVEKDSRLMAWLISLIILLTLTLSLRDWKLILISAVGLGGGMLWTVGLMGLLDIKLGPFNLIVIPTILGVSVDSVIHLTIAYQRYGPGKLGELFSVTGSLVTASVITTLAGYAGMLFTSHMGIASIGKIAILGFSSCLVIALIITPWLSVKLKAEQT